ncbi:hypothetical protein KFE25_011057 [Diacronema lutheri]|uniref:EF-hand domain-containing protein n=1 Tax=Diacronema lutheri TaxID=2081491 RepID=A0A8J5X5Q7_DIALT|nr:hypothetical protein KFE25_011057 [Diacronema lutheri]
MMRSLLATLLVATGVEGLLQSAMLHQHAQRTRSSVGMASVAKSGPFAPLVQTAKTLLGDEELNSLRGKVIGEHSKVIKTFVDSAETEFGKAALQKLFAIADGDGSGDLTLDEVTGALKALGFSYLTDAQIAAIFERADEDGSGTVDLAEFCKEAPRTLRTNLIKLAKLNGNELGFLV